MSFLSNIEMNLYKKSMFIHDYDVTGYTNVNLRCLRKKIVVRAVATLSCENANISYLER